MQSIAVYLHVYNCLAITIEYRSALRAITLIGGAAASEALIGGYTCTLGGCSTPQKQPRENAGVHPVQSTPTYLSMSPDSYCADTIRFS